jgi:outer membrane immunogenic protein
MSAQALSAQALSAQALAADMQVKALPPAPAFYDWSGVYVGVHAGYGGGMKDWPGNNGIGFGSDFFARGAFGGGQIGINKQLGSAVFGLELDGSWANISGSQSLVLGGPALGVLANQATSSKIDGLVTFAGRAGLAVDRWFVFAKGGLAVAHESHSNSASEINFPGGATTSLAFSGSETRVAPMLGFGAEYALGNNWSVKAEYDYIYMGTRNVDFSGTITAPGVTVQVPVISSPIEQAIHLAKLGVNYRFGGVATDPSFAPVRAASGYDWSGAYIGAEGAYGFGHNRWPNIFNPNIPDDSGKFDIKGGLGGATVGANAQAGVFVLGVEGDWMWSGVREARPFR